MFNEYTTNTLNVKFNVICAEQEIKSPDITHVTDITDITHIIGMAKHISEVYEKFLHEFIFSEIENHMIDKHDNDVLNKVKYVILGILWVLVIFIEICTYLQKPLGKRKTIFINSLFKRTIKSLGFPILNELLEKCNGAGIYEAYTP